MEKTTITVSRDTHKDLMLFKIRSNAKNLDQVINILIDKLKEELNKVPIHQKEDSQQEEPPKTNQTPAGGLHSTEEAGK